MSLGIETVVYYISSEELCIKELKQTHKLLPGFIEVVFHPNAENMTVLDLHSTCLGNEYGTHLMIHVCNEAKKRGISNVTLDDCSSRYRSLHNIYTKIGMQYDEDDGPEMSGKTNDISIYKTSTNSPIIYSLVL